MGITRRCPSGKSGDLETGLVYVIENSLSSAKEGEATAISVKHDQSAIEKSGALNLKKNELETSKSLAPPAPNRDCVLINRSASYRWEVGDQDSPGSISSADQTLISLLLTSGSSEHEAALKLQKVYKSFRTRRKLADCAVIVEQSWWKLLDFAELKRSSISFFEGEKHETAISRWSRAGTRAAKVGKGLSKSNKAKKLALQHWLEAIDPRHRYGHNLRFYYARWLQSQSREPFFYWLDLGEGKEMNLVDKCPRSKLQQQCIKYLGPVERKAYEIKLDNGRFFKKQTGEILDTTRGPKGAKWIFVLSTSRILYAGKKQKGTFQHSSFLAGGATCAAGQLVVDNGILRAVSPHSGHYRPTEENFKEFISFLKENNVDLTNVQMTPVNEEHRSYHTRSSNMEMRVNSYKESLTEKGTFSDVEGLNKVKLNIFSEERNDAALEFQKLGSKERKLTNGESLHILKSQDQVGESSTNISSLPSAVDEYESQEEEDEKEHEVSQQDSFSTGAEEDTLEAIHQKILQRVNSRLDLKSYQLGKQLSCTWTSGAGPRIGCVRDYPSELQNHALEMLSLSPRSAPSGRSHFKSTNPCRIGSNTPSTPPDMLFPQRSLPHSLTLPSLLWKANSLGLISFS